MARRFRHVFGLLAPLLVGIALISLLATGAMMLPDDGPQDDGPRSALAALASARVLCGPDRTGHAPPASHHHPANPALCPLNVALAPPSAFPTATPKLPVFSGAVVRLGTRQRPPARGPSSPVVRIGTSRGPLLTA